jgi:hypothetical protein
MDVDAAERAESAVKAFAGQAAEDGGRWFVKYRLKVLDHGRRGLP